MKFTDRVRTFLVKSLLGPPSSWSIREWSRALRGETLGTLTTDQLLRSSAVVACSQLISSALASVPLRVVQRVPSGGVRNVTQADAVSILLSLTWDDRNASVFQCCTLGNAWLYRTPDDALVALDSGRTNAYVDPQQQVWIREGGGTPIAYQDVAHLRFLAVPHYVLGVSPLLIACDSMTAALSITRAAAALARNIQHPGITLQAPSALSAKATANIKESWAEAVGGDKVGSVAILEEGLVANILKTPTALESDLVNSLEFGSADIARMFLIPGECIGLQKNSNRASTEESNRMLASRCLKPWGMRIGDRLSRLLLSDKERAQGLSVEHDLSELSIGMGTERGSYLSNLVATGVLLANEARNELSYEDTPGGDVLRPPANTQPANTGEMNGSTPKPNGAANGAAGASA